MLGAEVFADLRSHLALPVLVVGLVGGLIGATYLGALDLLRHVIGPVGHTAPVQIGILARRRAPSIGDVAQRLQLRYHSTMELVQRAEAAGVLDADLDPADHRRQLLRLTPTGEGMLVALSIQHRQELRSFRVQMTDLLALLD